MMESQEEVFRLSDAAVRVLVTDVMDQISM
jgi:hypothetical protein